MISGVNNQLASSKALKKSFSIASTASTASIRAAGCLHQSVFARITTAHYPTARLQHYDCTGQPLGPVAISLAASPATANCTAPSLHPRISCPRKPGEPWIASCSPA